MLIEMWGGMLFAMRDAMQAGPSSLGSVTAIGAFFGALLVFGLKTHGRILQSTVVDGGT